MLLLYKTELVIILTNRHSQVGETIFTFLELQVRACDRQFTEKVACNVFQCVVSMQNRDRSKDINIMLYITQFDNKVTSGWH